MKKSHSLWNDMMELDVKIVELGTRLELLRQQRFQKQREHQWARVEEFRQECGTPYVALNSKLLVYDGCWILTNGRFKFNLIVGQVVLFKDQLNETCTVINESSGSEAFHIPYVDIQKMYIAFCKDES